MALPNDKTTLNFVLDKSVKFKLQIMADAYDMKLGAYVSSILEKHIIKFEEQMLLAYDEEDFPNIYNKLFGDEYPPHVTIETDDNKKIIKTLNSEYIRNEEGTVKITKKEWRNEDGNTYIVDEKNIIKITEKEKLND